MSSSVLPASFSQEGHWIVEKIDGVHAPMLNVVRAFYVDGELSLQGLRYALSELMRRHEVLRTTLREVDGELVQEIHADAEPELSFVDLTDREECERDRRLKAAIREFSVRRFDLSQGPPLRASVLGFSQDRSVLILAAHHAAVDGWSGSILLGELIKLYCSWCAGEDSGLAPLGARYADFSRLQQRRMTGDLADGLEYWTRRLAGMPSQRPPILGGASGSGQHYAAATQRFTLPESLSQHVRDQARAAGTKPFVVLLSALAVVVQRHRGSRDVVLGTPFACRNESRWEGVVGPFANTVLLRVDVDPRRPVRDFIQDVRAVAKDATRHSEVPFHRVVRAIRSPNESNFSPYDAFFSLQNWPPPRFDSRLALTPMTLDSLYADCEQTWDLSVAGSAMGGQLDHQTSRLSSHAATLLLARFTRTLTQISAESSCTLGSLDLFSEHERRRLSGFTSGPVRAGPERPVPELIDQRARETPDAPALVQGERTLSFAEFVRGADQIAARLRSLGVRRGDSVAVYLPPSCELALALFGGMKSGASVAPIDPAEPSARRQAMLATLKPRVALVAADQLQAFEELAGIQRVGIDSSAPSDPAGASSPEPLRPEDVSNVFFTSGSSGVPKAAFGTHRALSWYVASMIGELALEPDDRVLQLSPVGFDVLFEELLPVLAAGGSVAFRDDYAPLEPERLLEQIERQRVSVVELPNVYWNALAELLEAGRRLPASLRMILIGCGAVDTERARRLLEHTSARLIHVYGLTEATITTTTFELTSPIGRDWRGPTLPIGRPLPNLTLYVLDEQMSPVPLGVAGQLYIGGEGLCEGYLGKPLETAARFVPDPFSPESGRRLLRTGDRVRWSDTGLLEFHGRVDEQVKVRGCRVELEEIETVLKTHPEVADALVAVADSDPDALVVAIVPKAAAPLRFAELRQFARERLPAYMCPSRWIALDALPTGAHGKADRRAVASLQPTPECRAPSPYSPTELVVAEVFAMLLGCPHPDRHANFFELGGHSLLAIRLRSRLNERFGTDLTLRDVFRCATVETLARLLTDGPHRRVDRSAAAESPGTAACRPSAAIRSP